MDEETIKQLETAWRREQTRLWRAFMDSLTPAQLATFRAYRRAGAMHRKLQRWRAYLRRGGKRPPKEVPWP
jgi:LPS sulfotransferase NodH